MINRTKRKTLYALMAVAVLSVSALGVLAVGKASFDGPRFLVGSHLLSKAVVMRLLDQVEQHLHADTYAPTPFDSAEFAYADLSHPYFDTIRHDPRVAHFYSQDGEVIDFETAVSMADYLRDRFPHGASQRNYYDANVLEMLDAAERGEHFLCGSIAKMLIQLVQAGGTQGRRVGLHALGSGHTVAEVWSTRLKKWAIIDPDYNVHYTTVAGTPLSALELYEMSQDGGTGELIRRIPGHSPNTLYNRETNLIEQFYAKGFTIQFYNRWVDQNLPRSHPAVSPAIMGYYLGNLEFEQLYYKHTSQVITDEMRPRLYRNPGQAVTLVKSLKQEWT